MKFLPAVFILSLLAACGGAYTSPSTGTAGTSGTGGITSILVSISGIGLDPSGSLLVGRSSQLTATARTATSDQDVTMLATWQSSNSTVATVSGAGLVTGIAPGTATMTATYQGRAGSLNVTVVR